MNSIDFKQITYLLPLFSDSLVFGSGSGFGSQRQNTPVLPAFSFIRVNFLPAPPPQPTEKHFHIFLKRAWRKKEKKNLTTYQLFKSANAACKPQFISFFDYPSYPSSHFIIFSRPLSFCFSFLFRSIFLHFHLFSVLFLTNLFPAHLLDCSSNTYVFPYPSQPQFCQVRPIKKSGKTEKRQGIIILQVSLFVRFLRHIGFYRWFQNLRLRVDWNRICALFCPRYPLSYPKVRMLGNAQGAKGRRAESVWNLSGGLFKTRTARIQEGLCRKSSWSLPDLRIHTQKQVFGLNHSHVMSWQHVR